MTNAEVTNHCRRYNYNKIKMLWQLRNNPETRCEIRRAIRMLKEIRDFGNTRQAY
jgi:hypothetical protein